MKIKRILQIFFAILVLELVALSYVMYAVVIGQQQLAEAENRRYEAYKLADELRQSSDDLTRMARSFVVTGDPTFEQYFNDILAIRDGEKPRPPNYERVYWDFMVAGETRDDEAGEAISLAERMEDLDLTGEEREQLRLAKANSDDLVVLENMAMAAVRRSNSNETGQEFEQEPLSREAASAIMFGDSYHAAKAAIMNPINDFLGSLGGRMNAAVAGQRRTVSYYTNIAGFLVALTLLTFGLLAIVIGRRVIAPVDKLVEQGNAIRDGAYGYQVSVQRDDEIGTLAGALNRMSTAISEDVSKRQQVTDTLVQQTNFLNTILESSPSGAAIVTAEGAIKYANSRALGMWGATEEEFFAAKAPDLYEDASDRARVFDELGKHGGVRDFEVRFKRWDGSVFWGLLSLEPTGADDESEYFAWAYDITARKTAEEELRASKEETEEALAELKRTQDQLIQSKKMASLGELTAGIAHEIKNPLNFVNNFAETSVELIEELETEIEDEGDKMDSGLRDSVGELIGTLKGDLGKINRHGQRANDIVQSMLLHARSDDTTRVDSPLNPLVSDAANLAYHGERAKDRNFAVTIDEQLDGSAGSAKIAPEAITRVMLNLIGNAFYAVKKRARAEKADGYKPTVTVTTKGTPAHVEIRVRDNGVGLEADVEQKMFEPFFTTKPPGEGTGLGLSMCYDIVVQQHGGTIFVEGSPGKGAEFVIELPRAPGGQPATSKAEAVP